MTCDAFLPVFLHNVYVLVIVYAAVRAVGLGLILLITHNDRAGRLFDRIMMWGR